MSSRTVAICIFTAVLITSISQVEAQGPEHPSGLIVYHPWIELPLLYLSFNAASQQGSLTFEQPEPGSSGTITLDPGENITLSIEDVRDRLYNVNIDPCIRLDTGTLGFPHLNCTLRCDGDGDGDFEYIINFVYIDNNDYSWGSEALGAMGNALNMTNGTLELEIARVDDLESNLEIYCASSSILIPFDVDTDNDGISDFTDEDNDNDGYLDEDDAFPWDPGEWKDTDGDGIGDNTDSDFNGNNIPDDLEIPLAMGIVLIPLIVIMVIMNKMKKKGKEEEGEWGEEDIPILTTPHEGPKNW